MSIENQKSGAGSDYTLNLPEECLSLIFQSPLLLKDDLDNCSLVCRRWLRIEGRTRRRLSLSLAKQSDLAPSIPSIFARFDSITDLSLKGGCLFGDQALILILISLECKNLTRLKLHSCDVTVDAVEAMLDICVGLEMLSFISTLVCDGPGGIEENNAGSKEIRLAKSFKVICVEEIDTFDDIFLRELIMSSKSLTTLKLISVGAEFSMALGLLAATTTEIHLEQVRVTDSDLYAISSCCPNLEILRLVKFFCNGSSDGIAMVAKRCKSLRVLHVDDYWYRGPRISMFFEEFEDFWDQGLMAVANNCPNFQELLLDGARVTHLGLEMLCAKCVKLERLTLCAIEDVSDAQLICITTNCNALNKLRIEYCPVTDRGVEALAYGCPNLAQVMFTECEALTLEGIDRLRASRGSLLVDFDKDGMGRAKRVAKQIPYRFGRWNRDHFDEWNRLERFTNQF